MAREIFKKFIGGVLAGMDKTVAANFKEMEKCASEIKHVPWKRFEWKSLGYVGAKRVAEHLKEKHLLETPPAVVVVEEEDGKKPKTSVFSVSHQKFKHDFWVGEARYRYLRSNGKSKEMFKDFSALRTAFWRDFDKRQSNIDKRGKAKATKMRDDASYARPSEIQREKKEAQEKEDEENRANPPQEMPPPPETLPPETPLPETPLPETPPPSETREAGDDSASE